ncbi:hypothetical protein [Lacticaseibacillus brantae]|nr:hypothetical protein [Lacticaseibacillus brantae]
MKHDRNKDTQAIIDMNDSLMMNAASHLPAGTDVAQQVVAATASGIAGLDALLNDNGIAQREYKAVASGYLIDEYGLSGAELEGEIDALMTEALHYLDRHQKDFDNWQK